MTIWQQQTQEVIDLRERDAYAAGLGDVWKHLLAQEENAARSVALGVVGALAAYLVESGYVVANTG